MSDTKKSKVIKKPVVVKRKNAKGYAKPASIKLGTILTDMGKKQWKIGPTIGSGGFGDIYLASSVDNLPKSFDAYSNVVKIEPHGNGPLFVEMHFYMRNAKLDDIQKFKRSKSLSTFGMPHFVANGSEDINNDKHRFIILPRYGKDIWSIFLENERKMPKHTVYRLAIEILNVLEYIHQCTYVHGDVKGANLLLGFGKNGDSQVFLVDFGLASHYTTKDFKPDPKKMHNGTIEYTSRDAHNGVPTMRGDLEILGYNLIHWLGAELPWEICLDKPTKVQESKENFMKNVDQSLEKCFQDKVSDSLLEFMKYVQKIKYDESPDYSKCRKMFESGLKALGEKNTGILEFTNRKEDIALKTLKGRVSRTPKKATQKVNSDSDEDFVTKTKKTPNKKSKSEHITEGTTIVTNSFENSDKTKKVYKFNFELNVSTDADVIVNVNRKRKSSGTSEKNKKETKGKKRNSEEELEVEVDRDSDSKSPK